MHMCRRTQIDASIRAFLDLQIWLRLGFRLLMIVPETFGTPNWSDFDGTTSKSNKFLVDDIYKKMKGGIKVILSGIQDSNYPISYPEQNEVTKKYIELTFSDEIPKNKKGKKPISKEKLMEDNMAYKRQSKKYFIGPATVSLERKHIVKNFSLDKIFFVI